MLLRKIRKMNFANISWAVLSIFLTVADLTSALILSKTSQTMEVDSSFMITCRDNNNGKSVTWKGPDGKTLNENTHPRMQVKTYGYSLFFERVRKEDQGVYTCVSQSTKEEEHFSLTVGADSYESGHQIETYHPNTDSGEEEGSEYVRNPHRGSTFVPSRGTNVESEEPDPTELENEEETTENPSGMHYPIQYPPVHTDIVNGEHLQFIRTPDQKEILEGTTDTIPCEALGGSTSWLVNGTEPQDGEKFQKGGDGLIVKNVSKEDEALEFKCCVVSENLGTFIEKKIKLIVLHKPRLVKSYQKQEIDYGIRGQHINLTCEVDSVPPPEVMTWNFKKTKARVYRVYEEKFDTGARSTFQLYMNNAAPDKYTCFMKNSIGDLTVNYEVKFGEKPDPPTSAKIVDVHSDGITLEILPPEDNPKLPELFRPTGFQIQYRVFENDTATEDEKPSKKRVVEPIRHGWACCWQDVEFSDDNTYTLTGLDPETSYEIQVATRNIAGTSDFVNFTEVVQTPSGANRPALNHWAKTFALSISALYLGGSGLSNLQSFVLPCL